jgi:hypothetical protein
MVEGMCFEKPFIKDGSLITDSKALRLLHIHLLKTSRLET